MTRTVYACDSCGWEWPHPTAPPEDAICPECGGPIERVHPAYVETMDVIEDTVRATRERAVEIEWATVSTSPIFGVDHILACSICAALVADDENHKTVHAQWHKGAHIDGSPSQENG